MPIMTRMKTHTPISAMAVSNTLLLGVRYNLAFQLKRERDTEKECDKKKKNLPYAVLCFIIVLFDRKAM